MQNKARKSAVVLLTGFMESGIKPVSRKNPEERPYTQKERKEMTAQMAVLKARIEGEPSGKRTNKRYATA